MTKKQLIELWNSLDDDTEIEWTDLSTDELAGLANVLENQ